MKQTLTNTHFVVIDKDNQEKVVEVLEVKRSQKCPPRFTINWNGKRAIIELQLFDDYRILFQGTLHGFPYVQAYLIGVKAYNEDIYIRLVR